MLVVLVVLQVLVLERVADQEECPDDGNDWGARSILSIEVTVSEKGKVCICQFNASDSSRNRLREAQRRTEP